MLVSILWNWHLVSDLDLGQRQGLYIIHYTMGLHPWLFTGDPFRIERGKFSFGP